MRYRGMRVAATVLCAAFLPGTGPREKKLAQMLVLLLATITAGCGTNEDSAAAEATAIYEAMMNSTEIHRDVPRDAAPSSRRDLNLAFTYRDMAQQFQQLADKAESVEDPHHEPILQLSEIALEISDDFKRAASNPDDYEYGEPGNVRLRERSRHFRSILDRIDPE